MSRLHELGCVRVVPAGTVLVEQGAEASCMYLAEGRGLMVSRTTANGKRIVMGWPAGSDIIGDTYGNIAPSTVEAIMTVRVRAIVRTDVLARMCDDAELGRDVAVRLAASMARADAHRECLAARDRVERVAWLLSIHAEHVRASDRATIEMPGPRAEIADHLGLHPDVVSRCFRQLTEMGILCVKGRCVTILDVRRLRAAAG